MKSKLLRIVISVALLLSLSLGCLAAGVGNGVYRDFGSGLLYPLGHAGVVYLVDSVGRPTYIVHMTSDGLKYVTLSVFKLGAVRPEEVGSYYGEYGVSGTSSAKYIDIRNKAYELYQKRNNISYVAFKQLVIKDGTSSKIEVGDIASIRCDGLVEYCYEYSGVKLLGATLWNITTRSYHPGTHDTVGINPISQRNSMNLISKS